MIELAILLCALIAIDWAVSELAYWWQWIVWGWSRLRMRVDLWLWRRAFRKAEKFARKAWPELYER